jgi:hypothetical protein
VEKLITALKQVVEADTLLRDSGNLLHLCKQKNIKDVLNIADKYHELPNPRYLETFELGLELGRIAKQKLVFRVKYIPDYIIYFMGSEADIIRRLNELPDAETPV